MGLEYELEVYRENFDGILGENDVNEGKFVVLKGDEGKWPFETYAKAIEFGYDRYGLEPFLVRKIERVETVHHI